MFERRRYNTFAAVLSFATVLVLMGLVLELAVSTTGLGFIHEKSVEYWSQNTKPSFPHRKLLVGPTMEKEEPDRIWGEKCTKEDIVINQGPTAPLSSGIPTYTVEIINVCVTGCDISGIHLSCGWFSSARLINPKIFKRLRYNDCLVNDGKPLVNGGTLSFEYANTHLYPLSVSRVIC